VKPSRPSGTAHSVLLNALVAACITLCLAASGWIVWKAFGQRDPDSADQYSSVLTLVMTAVSGSLALVLWWWRRRRRLRSPVSVHTIDLAADDLAGAVREQWSHELSARTLLEPYPIPVRWRLASAVLMSPARVIDRSADAISFAGSSDAIQGFATDFLRLPRRRLVVVGEAGTGKTTLAIQLLLEVLRHRADGDAVPVFLSVSSWDPAAISFEDWLVDELGQNYYAMLRAVPRLAGELVAGGWILPVLDGLDEAPSSRAAEMVAHINRDWGERPLILTGRTASYAGATAAEAVLTGAVVVEPVDVAPSTAARYLRDHLDRAPVHKRHPKWRKVLRALELDRAPTLGAVTATPLGLWMVRVGYIDDPERPDPTRLTSGRAAKSPARLRAHLIDQLIPAVVRARCPKRPRSPGGPPVPMRPVRSYTPDQIRDWLTTVAVQLDDDSARSHNWAWWNLPRYTFPRLWWSRSTPSGMAVFVFSAPVAGLVFGAWAGLLMIGAGISYAHHVGGVMLDPRHVSVRAHGRMWKLLRDAVIGLAGGLSFALAGSIQLHVFLPSVDDIALILIVAAASAVPITTSLFLYSDDPAARSTSPGQSYRGDRATAVAGALTAAVPLGLAAGLAVAMVLPSPTLSRSLEVGLLLGLAIGMLGGVPFGQPFGLAYTAWFQFGIASTVQWRRGSLPPPWRVMSMLEDCSRLGLLRKVGPVYQFRHGDLQDRITVGHRGKR
jgi:hypothetical protein